MIAAPDPCSQLAPLTTRPVGFPAIRFFARLARRRKRTRDSRALTVMDERILRDIGLSRIDIAAKSEKLFLTAKDV